MAWRRGAAAFVLGSCVAVASAQPAPMQNVMARARALTGDLSQLMTGERLNEPTRLRDMSRVMGELSSLLNEMAVHAEHGTLTAQQQRRLGDDLDRLRLMIDDMQQRIVQDKLQR